MRPTNTPDLIDLDAEESLYIAYRNGVIRKLAPAQVANERRRRLTYRSYLLFHHIT